MAGSFTLGAGTTLSITTDGGTSYTPINGIDSLGATGQTKSEVDVTCLEDTAKTYIAGISEGESKSITVRWDPSDAGQTTLATQAKAGNVAGFKIDFSNGSTATFDMTMLGWSIDDPSGTDVLKATASGRITGDITWA